MICPPLSGTVHITYQRSIAGSTVLAGKFLAPPTCYFHTLYFHLHYLYQFTSNIDD